MRRTALPALTGLIGFPLALVVAPLRGQASAAIDIPHETFVLQNGLTLIVHEDHKAPIVAVNVWYHVGSKNERRGRTGFAHLFEHLMFEGSEHSNAEFFEIVEPLGATDLNGTTNNDRTNYFENVPTSALDAVLWMESDRMGHLLGAITQTKLDEQRGVVQNEKRQGENQPYGQVYNVVAENTYPSDHPYSWSVIGSMDDLGGASLDDVHEWFRTYYGAANAVIVIAGDIDAQTAKAKVEHYFGAIDPGPPVGRQEAWVAKMHGAHRHVMQDRVPQARIYKVWNVPEWGAADTRYLDLVTDVLALGKTSRLYERLVYRDEIATDVRAYIDMREIGSQVWVQASARPGVELAVVERAMDEELGRLIAEGPSAREVERVRTLHLARFTRGIERIGGFGGKSDVLAENEVYGGRPDFYRTRLERVSAATPEDLRGAAERWLSDGVFVLEVHPFPEYRAAATDANRSAIPEPGAPPAAHFPAFERTMLSNGLQVIVAERRAVPLVTFRLLVDAGYAADQFTTPGTASLALSMLDEGTERRTALEISEELDMLGATLSSGSNLDMSIVSLSALRANLDASLDVFADVVLHPAFPETDFQRLRRQRLVQIQQEKAYPVAMALRVFSGLLYGEGHAYGNPLTGSGTEESVGRITRETLREFHRTWFKPNNATLIVVGATSLAEIAPTLEEHFAEWRRGEVPRKNLATVQQKQRSAVYLLDRPDAVQSVIFAGHVAPPKGGPDDIAIQTMNDILGGSPNSRLNMNVREEKGWSYGAFSILWSARGQQPFFVYAPVQSDKTKESMQEIAKELREIRDARPPTASELTRAKRALTLTLPGSWETSNAVAADLSDIVRYGLDARYYDTYAQRVRALTLDRIGEVARDIIQPDRVVWVVVGDRTQIEPGIRELDFGPLYEIDADGNVMGEIATQ